MTTQLSVKTDLGVKRAAQKKAAAQGVTLTLVVNKFLEKFASGDFEFTLVSVSQPDVVVDELFASEKIVKKANKISEYLSGRDL